MPLRSSHDLNLAISAGAINMGGHWSLEGKEDYEVMGLEHLSNI